MIVDWEHDENSPKLVKEKQTAYYSLVMQLSYLATQTRPDIAFAVNTISQYQIDCREHDWSAMLRIIQYLAGTSDHGLYYSKDSMPFTTLHTTERDVNDGWLPQTYADASYAQEPGRKSRSGHAVIMSGAAVTWYCKKQPVVALSSTEAEYYAMSEAIKELLWIRQLLNEVGMNVNDSSIVHQDNLSTMAIAMNPIQHQRVKHMDVKVHFIRDHLEKKDVKLIYCPTEDMVADILTKALPRPAHQKFTELLGLKSLVALQTVDKMKVWKF
jgi:hypothetical protein